MKTSCEETEAQKVTFKIFIYFYCVHLSILPACMYVYHVSAVLVGTRRGTGFIWHYKLLCVLGAKLGPSARAASALNCEATFPDPTVYILNYFFNVINQDQANIYSQEAE